MIEHVIFDLDGTLSDPSEGIIRSFEHTAQAVGVGVSKSIDWTRFIGPPIREGVAELIGTTDPARVERATTIYRERYGDVGLWENRVYPGVPELLAQLRARGHNLWICTGKPGVYARRIAERFGFTSWLSGVYGCELDGTRADKRDLLSYLLHREALEPWNAIMVGDRMHDVAAAKAHGLRCIGVLYGFGSRDELSVAGAEQLCASVAEIADVIAALA